MKRYQYKLHYLKLVPSEGSSVESGSPLDQILLSTFLCLGLLILAWRKLDVLEAIKKYTWPILLIGFMFVSIAWSDIPFISFKRWIRELTAIVMASLVITEQYPRRTVQSIFIRTAYILIPFSLLLIKYYPEYGVEYNAWDGTLMWIGVTTQKNGLGRLSLFAVFFLLWNVFRGWQHRDEQGGVYHRIADAIVIIMSFWLLIGSGSSFAATSIISLVVGFVTFSSLTWMNNNRINVKVSTLVAICALIIFMGIVSFLYDGFSIASLAPTFGRSESLTGRTELWSRLSTVSMKYAVLGHGYGGFWTTAKHETLQISGAHNGYLDIHLELGIIGLILVSAYLLSSCRNAAHSLAHDFEWASLAICFILITTLHNITESSLNSFTSHLAAVVLFLTVAVTEPEEGGIVDI